MGQRMKLLYCQSTTLQYVARYDTGMVHEVRLELTSPCGHQILSLARLPVPPFVHFSDGLRITAHQIDSTH